MSLPSSAISTSLQHLATRLRSAVDIRRGLIDINICFDVAGCLEKIARDDAVAMGETPVTNKASITSVIGIQNALCLESRGAAALLLYLSVNPNASHTASIIAEKTGYNTTSVRVFVSQLKKRLAELGLDGVIKTVWKTGYFISVSDAILVRKLIPGFSMDPLGDDQRSN